MACCLGFFCLDLLRHLGHRLEQVSHKAEVRDLEDGGLGVLVDSDDDLGVLHTYHTNNSESMKYLYNHESLPAKCWIAPEMPTAM